MTDRSKQPPTHFFKDIHLTFPKPIILSNGIKLWANGGGEDEINRLSLIVKGGTIHESKTLMAFFTATMLFNGNKYQSSNEIAEAIDYYGISKTFNFQDYFTKTSLSMLNVTFDNALTILSNCLFYPTFPAHEFDVIKKRYASLISTSRQHVRYLALEEMRRLYYGDKHPLARKLSPEEILSEDTTELNSFYQKFYSPSNTNILLSGHVTDKEINKVDEILGHWEQTKPETKEQSWEIISSPEKLSIVDKKGSVQAGIIMAIPAVARQHPDYFKLRILTMAFGGYFGSRIQENIREKKGYTYGISAYLLGRINNASINVETECNIQHTWDVIDEVKKEMKKLRDTPIDAKELHMVKQYMLSDLAKIIDSPLNIEDFLSISIMQDINPEYFNNQVAAILSVTPEELQQTAQKYYRDENLHIVIAGDVDKLKK
jgi:predicted Zn-dependent peptidase